MRRAGPILCSTLEELGVGVVFGLPGTQNVELFEALRVSRIRTVLATNETAASFMALGYGRMSGMPGVLVTIPGPGFTYALPGLAEARLDSVPLVHIVVQQPYARGRRYRHQEIDHRSLAEPLAKAVVEVRSVEALPESLHRAWVEALSTEPGPVVLWVCPGGESEGLKGASSPRIVHPVGNGFQHDLEPEKVAELAARLSTAKRPVLFLGQGGAQDPGSVRALAETVGMPFFTTPSARGTIPEDHPLCLGFDADGGGLGVLNELLALSDLILALGCKLSHNGTSGFRLQLPENRLVHVNSDPEALGANYPASMEICGRAGDVLSRLGGGEGIGLSTAGWTPGEVEEWRGRIRMARSKAPLEPAAKGAPSGTVRGFVELLREKLPRDAVLVTDSGLHQVMVRRHFKVLAPGGLLMPTDFQSMGFGLPAAIGANVANPSRKVVAVIGDGGLAISGMELLTLVRERIPVTVIVFNDGYLNLIKAQQDREYGASHAVDLLNPDMEAFAEACGAQYYRLDEEMAAGLEMALSHPGPVLAELVLGDSREMRSVRRRARGKAAIRRSLGQALTQRLKRLLRGA